jgi:tetratricopeptide (TPR) repeat protein
VPKITDFGLAKKLDEQGLTQTGAILGTPSYMAPEQAAGSGKTVGPAADVYALGAVLYECLTGRPPFRGATVLQTLEQVRTQEPIAPRGLQAGVPRELETICLKCLEKDPTRRYDSALALAEDLRRFAAGEPILARPVGAVGRAIKWARRRPALAALVMVSAAAALALALGGWWSSVRLRAALGRAERNRERAEANLEKAFAAVDRMLSGVAEERLKDVSEMDEVRQQLLKDALAVCQDLLDQEGESKDRVRREVGLARWRLGRIHALLGKTAMAEEDLDAARAVQEELAARFPDDPSYREQLAETCESQFLTRVGGEAKAEAAGRRAAELWQGLAPQGPRYQDRLAGIWLALGATASEHGGGHEAMELLRRAMDLRQRLKEENPGEVRFASGLALAHYRVGIVYRMRSEGRAAEVEFRAAVDGWELLAGAHPTDPEYDRQLAAAYANLGHMVAWDRARLPEAIDCFRKALDKAERLAHDYPRRVDYANQRNYALYNYANLLKNAGRLEQAVENFKRSAKLREELVEKNPGRPQLRMELAQTYDALGLTCAHLLQTREPSQEYFQKARGLLEPLVEAHPEVAGYAVSLGSVCINAGEVLREQHRADEALEWHHQAVRTLKRALALNPRSQELRNFAVSAHGTRAQTFERLGRFGAAAEDWSRAIELADGDPRRDLFRVSRALCWLRQGAHAAALAEAEEMAAGPKPDGGTLYNLACVVSLASAAAERDPRLSAPGRSALAEHCRRRALELLLRAHAVGAFATPEMLDTLRKDDDLAPLRGRDDFRQFLNEVSGPVKP